MFNPTLAVGSGAVLALASLASAWPGAGHVESFVQEHPGARLAVRGDIIRQVYGQAFSTGATAAESAESFRVRHARMLGAEPEELVPLALGAGAHEQPIMFLKDRGDYKFKAYFYFQERAGIPVFRGSMKLLVRNEPGYPLVLANAGLHDLGGFQVDPQQAAAGASAASRGAALAQAAAMSELEGKPEVVSQRKVIWAGDDAGDAPPVLADEFLVGIDVDRWLVLIDAATGNVLFTEHRVYFIDIAGSASGLTTEGEGADFCEAEVSDPLPYLLVTAGANNDFTDVNGEFLIPNPGAGSINVSATLNGDWFDVENFLGAGTSVSQLVTPPGPADLLFNAANTDEFVRAQVNCYVHANRIRDYVLQYEPSYPFIFNEHDFAVVANRTDGFCPGNAWYSGPASNGSINFCRTGGGAPNTAWSSVIYHEYGHHIVEAAGSGQCQYGEGMGDVMSVLVLDSPEIGIGFFGNCNGALRSADNECQYSQVNCTTNCGGPCHDCGRLLSGSVWSTRNELLVTEPSAYRDILSAIALGAVLMHQGSSIDPSVTVDYLTADDDDPNVLNGTPHFEEIAAGFGAHGLPAPDISLLAFEFPGGLPGTIAPSGGTTATVEVNAVLGNPEPGTGKLVIDTGTGFVEIPMEESQANVYTAEFPASACATLAAYYFSAETTLGELVLFPENAPADTLIALSAGSTELAFADDFETNLGWGISTTAADGPWQRAVPISQGTCNRGNPGTDADGSGQCYLTDNDQTSCNSDVDDGSTILTSPIMDASGDTFISYWRWYSNIQGSNPFQDIFVVQVSGNSGASWVNLETVGPAGLEVDGGWFRRSFRESDFVTPNNQFRIRFNASDTDPQSIVEAAVDGVELLRANCEEQVFGDIDGDNLVGVSDLLIMLGAWGPCQGACPPHCAGDLDNDCVVGVADLLLLLGAWSV